MTMGAVSVPSADTFNPPHFIFTAILKFVSADKIIILVEHIVPHNKSDGVVKLKKSCTT